MKYHYPQAGLERFTRLLPPIDAAAHRLSGKLLSLDPGRIGISDYNQRYLKKKLKSPVATMNLYGYLLLLSLEHAAVPLDQFVFVDYGGGCGIMSLLAKELGIGRVIYNDIYDVSCRDVQRVAKALKIPIDDYVCGDVEDLLSFAVQKKVAIQAAASFDVIEHVYNLDDYIQKLSQLPTGNLRLVFASTANPANPLVSRKLRKLHLEYEYKQRKKVWGHKERDSLESFYQIRRQTILEMAPHIGAGRIDQLARATRGLMLRQVEALVEAYLRSGEFEHRPPHPTNTCDPFTGNGIDNLLNFRELKSQFGKWGFGVSIQGGYWPYTGNQRKRRIRGVLNTAIRVSGGRAVFLSPYYIAVAERGRFHHRGTEEE